MLISCSRSWSNKVSFWLFAGFLVLVEVISMDPDSWAEIYTNAGGRLSHDVVQAIQESSSHFYRTVGSELHRTSDRAPDHALASSSQHRSEIPIEIEEEPHQEDMSLREAEQLTYVQQRHELLEHVEAWLDERTGHLLTASIYPSHNEIDDKLYSTLAAHLQENYADYLYHLREDFYLTTPGVKSQVLDYLIPQISDEIVSRTILVWKRDSHLVRTHLRLLGALQLGNIEDQPRILSRLEAYKLPQLDISREQQVDQVSPPTATGMNQIPHEDPSAVQVNAMQIQQLASVQEVILKAFHNSRIAAHRYSEVVLGAWAALPPKDFQTWQAMIQETLTKPSKHFYQLDQHIVATRLDMSTGSLEDWTGDPGPGFGLVLWRVDPTWSILSFHGVVKLRSYHTVVKFLADVPRYVFVKSTAVQVMADRSVYGQLRLAPIRSTNRG